MSPSVRINRISTECGEHEHGFAQILFGYHGVVDCEYNHGGFRIKQGHALVLPENEKHYYRGQDSESLLIVVDLPFQSTSAHALISGVDLNVLLHESAGFRKVTPLVGAMLHGVAGNMKEWEKQPSWIVGQTALLLASSLIGKSSTETRNPGNKRRISRELINDLLDRRIATPPTVTELASMLNMSVSSMTEKFHQATGMSPKKYINTRRMVWAKVLIANGQYNLSQVAYELGFSSQSSFNRAFNSHYGFNPKELKKLLHEEGVSTR